MSRCQARRTRSVWDEAADAAAARAGGRVAFDWQDCLLARPGRRARRCVRRRAGASAGSWSPLAERVRAAFDPEGVLA